MTAEGHQLLGHYLAQKYMNGAPRRYTRAFLIGCVQPDKNPTTYIKGSIRSQWLRGHNWGNSQRYIHRLTKRLERKERLYLLDFYTMGKLIHYTTDAFTFAHNECFQENLMVHRRYERTLQRYFSRYLESAPEESPENTGHVMDMIRENHQDYENAPNGVYVDSRFAVSVCSSVLEILLDQKMVSAVPC